MQKINIWELMRLMDCNGYTTETLGEQLLITKSVMATKLNGNRPFSEYDIKKIRIIFDLNEDDILRIFFPDYKVIPIEYYVQKLIRF